MKRRPGPSRTRLRCRDCGAARHQDPDQDTFVGGRCRDCHNAWRRIRYEHDMDYRSEAILRRRRNYDKDKHRNWARRYRARKRQEEKSPENSGDGDEDS